MKKEEKKQTCECGCSEEKNCGCLDGQECTCGDSCTCEECSPQQDEKICPKHGFACKESEYLNIARQIQADFDNYRKKSMELINLARQDGQIETALKFLPALDSFAEAKKMVTDKNILKGIEMVESQIYSALEALNIKKIETVGKKFNPNFHNALAIVNDSSLEDGIIKDEYQAGYKMNDKVIRYSQVIVNKREEK